jgi:hypothetical protein
LMASSSDQLVASSTFIATATSSTPEGRRRQEHRLMCACLGCCHVSHRCWAQVAAAAVRQRLSACMHACMRGRSAAVLCCVLLWCCQQASGLPVIAQKFCSISDLPSSMVAVAQRREFGRRPESDQMAENVCMAYATTLPVCC